MNDQGTIIERSMLVQASPASVWKALTEPELIRLYQYNWMAESEWKRGTPISWTERVGPEGIIRAKGTIMESLPGHRLRYTYYVVDSGLPDEAASYTTVDITLDQQKDGRTLVTLWHGDFAGLPQDVRRTREAGRSWVEALVGLKRVSEEQNEAMAA